MSRQKEYVAYRKGEVWKLIKIRTYNCHQKDYYVSNMGRVASKSRNKKGAVMQVLKQYVDKKTGRATVKIREIYFYVHRLVAMAFCPNPYNKKIVHHIDGDKHNNVASNLKWVTRREHEAIHRRMKRLAMLKKGA